MYDDDLNDRQDVPERSETVLAALAMDLDNVEVEEANGDEDEPTTITFTDGNTTVELSEREILSDVALAPFLKAWVSWCEAGSALYAEEQAERMHFSGGGRY